MYRSHYVWYVLRTGLIVQKLSMPYAQSATWWHAGSSAWVGVLISAIRGICTQVGTSVRIVQGRVKPDLNPDYYL